MKESIEYYYDINIVELNENNNVYSFFLNDTKYIFVLFIRSINDIDDIINVSKELKLKNIPVMDIMYNRKKEVITKINDSNYIMLKVQNNYMEEVDFFEMINNKCVTSNHLKNYKNNWGELWSSKIDYYEYQVSELASDKKIILDSFSYYVGLAENAISIVNKVNASYEYGANENIVLSHRRIFFPNIQLNYYNPLSYIFDLKIRDVGEYIKSMFFSSSNALLDLSLYLKCVKLSIYEYNMLFARILYPTYYFDIYEKVMLENLSENELLKIISRVDEFEMFLKKAHIEISKYALIESVEWLY